MNRADLPLTTKPSITLKQMMGQFATEQACKTYIRDLRWPDGVVKCPRCKDGHVHEVGKKPWHWQCRHCNKNGYRFSILTGTIFENTKYPLVTWFQVAYLLCQSKKGMSALQIHRQIGSASYETAWYMCTRIRAAMKNHTFEKPIGEVEADETLDRRKGSKQALGQAQARQGAASRKQDDGDRRDQPQGQRGLPNDRGSRIRYATEFRKRNRL